MTNISINSHDDQRNGMKQIINKPDLICHFNQIIDTTNEMK